jgi:hypothetical protein
MGIQKNQCVKKQGKQTQFFPFFQAVKSRRMRRDFFRASKGEALKIIRNSNR